MPVWQRAQGQDVLLAPAAVAGHPSLCWQSLGLARTPQRESYAPPVVDTRPSSMHVVYLQAGHLSGQPHGLPA